MYLYLLFLIRYLFYFSKTKSHIFKSFFTKEFLWQIDFINISDYYKNKNSIFGIIDSGSRAILFLQRLENKSTITILKAILYSLEKYGKPKIIKSDNEIIFNSKLFKFSLWLIKYNKVALILLFSAFANSVI